MGAVRVASTAAVPDQVFARPIEFQWQIPVEYAHSMQAGEYSNFVDVFESAGGGPMGHGRCQRGNFVSDWQISDRNQ
jgi:hypothetical protein